MAGEPGMVVLARHVRDEQLFVDNGAASLHRSQPGSTPWLDLKLAVVAFGEHLKSMLTESLENNVLAVPGKLSSVRL
jgi:hypothetical protein